MEQLVRWGQSKGFECCGGRGKKSGTTLRRRLLDMEKEFGPGCDSSSSEDNG